MPSIEEIEKLVQQFPDKPFPRYGLAMEYKKAGRLEDAVTHFRKAVELDPKYVAAYHHCGLTLETLGKRDEAIATFRQGLAIAKQIGNGHAAKEINEALAAMGA